VAQNGMVIRIVWEERYFSWQERGERLILIEED
jgi:hypothetical protein